MNLLAFQLLKLRLQYYDPVEITDSKGVRKGQFLFMHDTDRNTFGFYNAETEQQEILRIEDVEIRPL